MPKEMTVAGVTVDPVTKSPVVVLRDLENQRVLPIWIGLLEANAIVLVLEGVDLPRPMTHDLLKSILENTGTRLRKVEITDIRDNTYFAALHLERGGGAFVIDSRPSDAIALALRCSVPIVVAEGVFSKAMTLDEGDPASGEKDRWTELLEKMDPGQFSKYKM
jgi:bifunctional DNase/RNase